MTFIPHHLSIFFIGHSLTFIFWLFIRIYERFLTVWNDLALKWQDFPHLASRKISIKTSSWIKFFAVFYKLTLIKKASTRSCFQLSIGKEVLVSSGALLALPEELSITHKLFCINTNHVWESYSQTADVWQPCRQWEQRCIALPFFTEGTKGHAKLLCFFFVDIGHLLWTKWSRGR